MKIADLPDFDPAEYLKTEEDIAAYLTCILEENDASLLASALGDIAKSRGMTEMAKSSGITREALYKALRPNAQPRFNTISKVCNALGVQLSVSPIVKPSRGLNKKKNTVANAPTEQNYCCPYS